MAVTSIYQRISINVAQQKKYRFDANSSRYSPPTQLESFKAYFFFCSNTRAETIEQNDKDGKKMKKKGEKRVSFV